MKTKTQEQIAKLLTQGSEQLDAQILSSLRESRMHALQKQRVTEHAYTLSAIGHRAMGMKPHTPQQWVAATILLAALVMAVAGYWQNLQEPPDIDILTDDLPIEVFVDQE